MVFAKDSIRKKHKLRPLLANSYVFSFFIISLTALLAYPLSGAISYYIIAFVFLLSISLLATFMSMGPILLACVLSSLIWNFFFIPPSHTFHIDKTEDLVMFAMFFIIAILNGILSIRIRTQKRLADEREQRTNMLLQLTKGLSQARGVDEVLSVAESEINKQFSFDASFVLQNGHDKLHTYNQLTKKKLDSATYKVAENLFIHANNEHRSVECIKCDGYSYFLLRGTRSNLGVIIVNESDRLFGERQAYWDTFLTQISNALEREYLGDLAQKVKFLDESDKLYKTLFNSISHEFRIPVATILGASEVLVLTNINESVRVELSQEILTASLRLNRLIENLLNMSRLESGRISLRVDWYDVEDLVNKLSDDLQDELSKFNFCVDIQKEMPLIWVDFGLMEQVLYNLLINACEHAPQGSTLRLNVRHAHQTLVFQVLDHGIGFPEEKKELVFDKFYRMEGARSGGIGLGLSIVKGFVDAHKGTVQVDNRKSGGACFTVKLPSPNPDVKNMEEK